MKKWIFIIIVVFLTFSGCSDEASVTNEPSAPTATWIPPTATALPATKISAPTATSSPTLPPTEVPLALSFSPTWFRDEQIGFAFQYPDEWQVSDFAEQYSRAIIRQLENEGEFVLQITAYRWDPTGALPEYLDQRRLAWESSGLDIASEELLTLASGQPAAAITLNTLEGDQAYFFYVPIDEYYLELAGSGDIDLLAEVASTLELFEPAEVINSPSDCTTVGPDDELWVQCNVMAGLQSRNLSALHGYMGDPFTIAYWGSEGRVDTPAGITAELQEYRLPADTNLPLSFTTDRAEFPPLAGMPPEQMFGPNLDVIEVIYSEGWGLDGQGAALLYIVEGSASNVYWFGLVYSDKHFDK